MVGEVGGDSGVDVLDSVSPGRWSWNEFRGTFDGGASHSFLLNCGDSRRWSVADSRRWNSWSLPAMEYVPNVIEQVRM